MPMPLEHQPDEPTDQTILRREGHPQPYEALKALTRTHGGINEAAIGRFIDELDV